MRQPFLQEQKELQKMITDLIISKIFFKKKRNCESCNHFRRDGISEQTNTGKPAGVARHWTSHSGLRKIRITIRNALLRFCASSRNFERNRRVSECARVKKVQYTLAEISKLQKKKTHPKDQQLAHVLSSPERSCKMRERSMQDGSCVAPSFGMMG